MAYLINQSTKNLIKQGWTISDKNFFNVYKRKCDPIAALIYHDIYVDADVANAFYVGFLNTNKKVHKSLNEYVDIGKMSRRVFLVRSN